MKLLKKLVSVFLIVGLGQYLSIYFVGFLDRNYDDLTVASVAKYDAAILLITSFLSLGIGQYFSRLLIEDASYEESLKVARSLRLLASLGLVLLSPFVFLFGEFEYGLAMSLSPILALGVEYALYVRGYQISAAACAFIKMSFAYAVLLSIPTFFAIKAHKEYFPLIFVITIFSLTFLSSLLSIRILGKHLVFNLSIPSKNTVLGVVQLGGAFFIYSSSRTLIVPFADFFSSEKTMVAVFIFVKLYLVFFSIRRVYVQVIHAMLANDKKAKYLNVAFCVSMLLFIAVYMLLNSLYSFDVFDRFVGLKFEHQVQFSLLILGLAAFSVYPTKLLLLHDDGYYKAVMVTSSVVFLILIVPILRLYSIEGLVLLCGIFEFTVGLLCCLRVKKIISLKPNHEISC